MQPHRTLDAAWPCPVNRLSIPAIRTSRGREFRKILKQTVPKYRHY